jgi:hypothetical protein
MQDLATPEGNPGILPRVTASSSQESRKSDDQ